MTTIIESIKLTVMSCGECGGSYAINEHYRQQCQDHSRSWTCPYCRCGWGYQGKTKAELLAAELDIERTRLDHQRQLTERAQKERDDARNRERAQKAAKTRIKNRIAKGVCPCCNRQFKNLHRHMTTQHPDYVDAEHS